MRLHVVNIVLINDKKEILGVSRKNNHKDINLVGGKVDLEDFIQPNISDDKNINIMAALIKAAIRETKEETGLDIFDLEIVYGKILSGRMQWTFIANWEGEIYTEEPHVVEWVNKETLMKGSFREYNLEVLNSLNEIGIYIK